LVLTSTGDCEFQKSDPEEVNMKPMLTRAGCLERQRRFREHLAALDVDAAFVSDPREIYYLTGALLERWPVLLMLDTRGGAWLAAHTDAGEPTVDDVVTYPTNVMGTMNPDPLRLMNVAVARRLGGMPSACHRVGWQAEAMPYLLAATLERTLQPKEWAAVDDVLADLESRKDPDEVELIRFSVQADLAGYTAAQAAISPGANELDVLAAGQRGAMHYAGEPVYHTGDYRCGEMGGSARDHRIEAGELYIVDAWTTYRGYWSDLSRTYAVGEVTDLQRSVHEHVAAIQREAGAMLRPGLRGTELWSMIDERLREHSALADSGYQHHAGHGVGLRAHEAPDLNRDREGILEVGNVVSVEPGGYTAQARAGARIENMYLITEMGALNLSEYPMNLVPVK
jgi:Xaa-Pro aminopeptidase